MQKSHQHTVYYLLLLIGYSYAMKITVVFEEVDNSWGITLQPNQKLVFSVIEPLGEGGSSTVFLGTLEGINKQFALKVAGKPVFKKVVKHTELKRLEDTKSKNEQLQKFKDGKNSGSKIKSDSESNNKDFLKLLFENEWIARDKLRKNNESKKKSHDMFLRLIAHGVASGDANGPAILSEHIESKNLGCIWYEGERQPPQEVEILSVFLALLETLEVLLGIDDGMAHRDVTPGNLLYRDVTNKTGVVLFDFAGSCFKGSKVGSTDPIGTRLYNSWVVDENGDVEANTNGDLRSSMYILAEPCFDDKKLPWDIDCEKIEAILENKNDEDPSVVQAAFEAALVDITNKKVDFENKLGNQKLRKDSTVTPVLQEIVKHLSDSPSLKNYSKIRTVATAALEEAKERALRRISTNSMRAKLKLKNI